jgi:hypothetical protein
MALLSKIARLPRHVREELNQRLDNGELGPIILPWLNGLSEVQKIIIEQFKGVPVSDQNLSTWRETGYARWQQGQERILKVRQMAELAVKMGDDASKLFSGSNAIAAGHIMELLEDLDPDAQRELLAEKPEMFTELLDKLAKLTKAHTESDRTALDKLKHETAKDKLQLDRERYEFAQAQAVLKHAKSKEVQKIVSGPGTNSEKIAALRARMFPQRGTSSPTQEDAA